MIETWLKDPLNCLSLLLAKLKWRAGHKELEEEGVEVLELVVGDKLRKRGEREVRVAWEVRQVEGSVLEALRLEGAQSQLAWSTPKGERSYLGSPASIQRSMIRFDSIFLKVLRRALMIHARQRDDP